jgi:hypothetical protein
MKTNNLPNDIAMKKTHNCIFLFLLFCNLPFISIFGQNLNPVNHETVYELEAVQTPAGTFVAAVMEQVTTNTMPYIVIYRSSDNGVSWDSITSVVNTSAWGLSVGDPVLAIDSAGVINLVIMHGSNNAFGMKKGIIGHLRLYQSTNDGLSWQLKGEPFSGNNGIADYPQLISSGSGKLEMTYALTGGSTDSILYVASADAGSTWSSPVVFSAFPPPSALSYAIGCDLGITGNSVFCLAFGDGYHDSIYFSKSLDSGISWQPLTTIPGIISFSVNKMICRKGMVPIGILSHEPHKLDSPLYFSVSNDLGTTWMTTILSNSASHGEGFLDASGIFHVIYCNTPDSNEFRLMYTWSDDYGASFKDPVILYSGTNTVNWYAIGEYQSLILANDNLFHLTFVDNSDSAHAKQIIFSPMFTGIEQQSASGHLAKVFPNPVKDVLTIALPPGSDFRDYELTDLKGLHLQSGQLRTPETKIKIAGDENGMFLLKLFSRNRVYISKIISFK